MSALQAEYRKFTLQFRQPMGTSRGVLHQRDTFIVAIRRPGSPSVPGLGECAPLPGLSPEPASEFEPKLQSVCRELNSGAPPAGVDLADWPAIRFGVEAALLDLESGGNGLLFVSEFTGGKQPIPTNGLVVMADIDAMRQQAFAKIAAGFRCIKIKIGAHDFGAECDLLAAIRSRHAPGEIELRLDANGAFAADEALPRLQELARFHIHSLEQPIRPGQPEVLARLCRRSPIPVALDEELIGIHDRARKKELLARVKPAYIILKPTLVGGLSAAMEWIELAGEAGIDFWVTSALESNIGLNIISQWAATLAPRRAQGLGTGQLFRRNFPAPLDIAAGALHYLPDRQVRKITTLSDLNLEPE